MVILEYVFRLIMPLLEQTYDWSSIQADISASISMNLSLEKQLAVMMPHVIDSSVCIFHSK